MVLYNYPKNAAFGRPVPKSKIYEHTNPNTALKQNFVGQVQQIIWEYKLAPETINLHQTQSVPELQIFKIILKEDGIEHDVLRCIDRAIPFPIIFELYFEEKIKVVAAYKRPSLADSSKWVLSNYFETPWISNQTTRMPLPVVLDLQMLYAHLISLITPFPSRPGELLEAHIERVESIRFLQREIDKCHSRMQKEKQFSNKIAINAELRTLKQKLEDLACPVEKSHNRRLII